jgi:predicted anti-sigma-YlaC factor YlaD
VNDEHIDVGAYALGLLETEDSTAFETHLASCPSCRAELTEFSPMKALLADLGPVESPEDAAEQGVIDLMGRRAAASRRRVRWTVAVGAAACLAVLGGGLAAGIAVAPSPGPATAVSPVLTGQLHSATNPQTGVTGTVGLVSKAWGTYVTLDLADVHGPLECELIAVAKTGERRVVAGWKVGVPGDGVPGHPAHLLVAGSTAISLAELARFDVIVVNGPTLLSVTV